MKTFMIAASALALATPALAQTTVAPAATPPAASTTASTGVTTPAPDGSATTATATAAPAAATPAPATPQAAIAAEFPSHDKDGNGALSAAEFDVWLTALQERGGTKLTPAQRTAWLAQSFVKADANKSKSVDLAEITTFLMAQA